MKLRTGRALLVFFLLNSTFFGCGIIGSRNASNCRAVAYSQSAIAGQGFELGRAVDPSANPISYSLKVAQPFLIDGSDENKLDIVSVSVRLLRVGKFAEGSTDTITASIYSSVSDTPGEFTPDSVVGSSKALEFTKVSDKEAGYILELSKQTRLTSGVVYFVVLETQYLSDGTNYIEWVGREDTNSGSGFIGPDGQKFYFVAFDSLKVDWSVKSKASLIFSVNCNTDGFQ